MNRDVQIHGVRISRTGRLIVLGLLVTAPAVLCHAQPGQVVGWGNSVGGRYGPQQNRECMTLCAGGYHSLALTADGTLMAWGENTVGQCNIPFGNNFVAISAGLYHNLALKADGTVVAWGDNTRGQCNVPRNTKFRAIAAGSWHSLGIRLDGSLAAWGWDEYGQCGVPEGRDYTEICGGYYHSMALKIDGSIVAWGANGDGQTSVPQGARFIQIAAGTMHSVALRADGTLVAWGRNSEGQCRVPSGNDFVAVTAGSLHNLALRRDGRIEAWGQNGFGQCDVPEGGNFAVIAAGSSHSLAIRDLRKQFLATQSAEPQVTRVEADDSQAAGRTTPPSAGIDQQQMAGPGLSDLVLANEMQDSNSISTEKLLSTLERSQPVAVKQAEPPAGKDPNATRPKPASTEQVKSTAPTATAKTQDVAKSDPSKQPASTQKETARAQDVKPPATAATEPNKPAIDFENPANQGFAPGVYMGVIENAAPVYHFVSTNSKRHFCTISEEEKYKLIDNQSDKWKYQGIAFFAYPEGQQPKDARPVYRFWSESLGQHFYTMDETTKDLVTKSMANVWKYEGVAWYAPAIKKPGQKKK